VACRFYRRAANEVELMKFVSEHKNPLPDLVELKTKVAAKEGDNDKLEMLVELRIHPHEIDETIGTITVEITEAILSVEFSGLEAVPKTKRGQPILDPIVRREVQRERSVSTSADHEKIGRLGGSFGLSTTGGTAKVEARGSTTSKTGEIVTEKETKTDSSEFYRVLAIGNDNWRISEENAAPLDGVYVDHDPLCEVTPIPGSNRAGVEAKLVVRQRHVKTKLASDRSWWRLPRDNNKQKIADILIAKCLHAAGSDQPFDGKFVFAKSQSIDEG
jgi:hypothetical protein